MKIGFHNRSLSDQLGTLRSHFGFGAKVDGEEDITGRIWRLDRSEY